MRALICILFIFSVWAAVSQAEAPPALHVPAVLIAGEATTVANTGSGSETFYLIGLGHVAKREIRDGENIQLSTGDLATAGNYQAILCSGGDCTGTDFYVAPASAKDLIFLVHPSRVAVGDPNAISAVTVVLDRFRNLVLQPQAVVFRATTKDSAISSPPQMENARTPLPPQRCATELHGSAWIPG